MLIRHLGYTCGYPHPASSFTMSTHYRHAHHYPTGDGSSAVAQIRLTHPPTHPPTSAGAGNRVAVQIHFRYNGQRLAANGRWAWGSLSLGFGAGAGGAHERGRGGGGVRSGSCRCLERTVINTQLSTPCGYPTETCGWLP